MKLLYICQRFPPCIGGAERAVYELSTRAAKKHDVTVIATDHKGIFNKYTLQDGVKVFRYRSFAPNEPSFSPQIIPAVIKHNPDLIHLHVYNSFPAPATYFAKQIKSSLSPVVFTPHFHPESTTALRNLFRLFYDSIFLNRLLDFSSKVIVVSNFEKKLLSNYVSTKKIDVIPNGVNFEEFSSANSEAVLKKYNLVKNVIILYTGYLAKYKGVHVLLQAYKELKNRLKNSNLVLIIAGDGPAKLELLSLVKKMGLSKSVLFTGYLKRTDVVSLICACDIFVLPSSYEAFSIVTCEAMYCRKPVVATKVGGVPELGIDSEFLVPFGDSSLLALKLEKLLTDDELYKKMGDLNHQKAQKFNWDRVTANHIKMYQSIIK